MRGGVFFKIMKRSRFGLKNIIFGCESYAFTWWNDSFQGVKGHEWRGKVIAFMTWKLSLYCVLRKLYKYSRNRELVDFSVSGFFLSLNDPNAPNVFWIRFILEHEYPECPECLLDTFYSWTRISECPECFLDTFYSWTRMKRMGYEHCTPRLSWTRIIKRIIKNNHKLYKWKRIMKRE